MMLEHVGIIPDGNRRWAKRNNVGINEAYSKGYSTLERILKALLKAGVTTVSVYALSRDNCVKRGAIELRLIYGIAVKAFQRLRSNGLLEEKRIRVNVIGDLSLVPSRLRKEVYTTMRETSDRDEGLLNIALCYSPRWEIEHYLKRGVVPPSLRIKPIDLLIRTGGARRISGFFPLLLEYAEMYFTDTLWPDFSEEELWRAVSWFKSQKRNFGT